MTETIFLAFEPQSVQESNISCSIKLTSDSYSVVATFSNQQENPIKSNSILVSFKTSTSRDYLLQFLECHDDHWLYNTMPQKIVISDCSKLLPRYRLDMIAKSTWQKRPTSFKNHPDRGMLAVILIIICTLAIKLITNCTKKKL